jgi:hypothetical protein
LYSNNWHNFIYDLHDEDYLYFYYLVLSIDSLSIVIVCQLI